MSKPILETLPKRLSDHRSVQAWTRLDGERRVPDAIDIIEVRRKSSVYRLRGIAQDGSAIIAKRSRRRPALVERAVYEQILPRLPLPSLRCHGFLEEPDGEFCWLFLDEAHGVDYSPSNPEHCGLTARWLAALHATSLDGALASCFPDRGPRHYLGLLRSFRTTALEHLADPGVGAADREVLESLAWECDLMEARWDAIAAFCGSVPATLVHGDLVVKNVRVGRGPDGPTLLAFDWENAGHGVAGCDLVQDSGRSVSPDLRTYCTSLSGRWRSVDLPTARKLAAHGRFFRLLDVISWAATGLRFGSYTLSAKPMSYLRAYERRLHDALVMTGWAH